MTDKKKKEELKYTEAENKFRQWDEFWWGKRKPNLEKGTHEKNEKPAFRWF
ncbi:MAG TPA: hypothetical protein VEY51_19990 [Chondromyces sp.]|nr:hypothetical protein [Chondromyces sp.]